MQLTIVTEDDKILAIEVDRNELVENVKAILEVEVSIPLAQQRIVFNGRELQNSNRLSDAGVGETDMLMLVKAAAGGSTNEALAMDPADGSARNPQALLAYFNEPANLANLRAAFPELAQVVSRGDANAMQELLRLRHRQRQEMERKRQEEIDLSNMDPFDVDAQRRIEEAIHQKNIDENWQQAIEYNPEAFARVVMLYVDSEVNGVPLKAFVDSGAQMTIMSKKCAERTGLLRLIDKRYTGMARGVGSSAIIGKVHLAPLKIGGHFFECSFTILDQNDVEFIFGLDMLRKHQCMIDLKDNVLRVGGGEISVPFLAEKDIPQHLLGGDDSEAGPSGNDGAPAQGASQTIATHPPAPLHGTGGSGAGAPVGVAAPPGQSEQELKISRLMELGFDRARVVEALAVCQNNEEHAASFLFGGGL
eukprot:TRINITY_DN22839_c0_g1_i1.p1 TRINITY_DN22839_c0_g1~~TRINITY_DN22839_c0_g1_i1.p1  ORF type:complete len:420 (-),score=96.04 TRINITY_DN22839_c0_g1_i1:511-1770(-)